MYARCSIGPIDIGSVSMIWDSAGVNSEMLREMAFVNRRKGTSMDWNVQGGMTGKRVRGDGDKRR